MLQLKYYFNAVDAVYQNYYAVREGLTEVVVKNMTTGAEVQIETGSYVQNLAISSTKLIIKSGIKVDVFDLIDQQARRREVDSVLRLQHQKRKGQIEVTFLKSLQIRFKCSHICVASEHLII